MATKLNNIPQNANEVPFTPITADATHIAVPDIQTQAAIDTLSKAIKAIPAGNPDIILIPNFGALPIIGVPAKLYFSEDDDGFAFWDSNSGSYKYIRDRDSVTEQFGFVTGTATVGDHFIDNVEGTYYLQIPFSYSTGRLETATLYINSGQFPATATTVKLVRKPLGSATLTDIASFAVPASENGAGGAIFNTIGSLNLNQNDKLFVNISQNCPDVDFTIGANIQFKTFPS